MNAGCVALPQDGQNGMLVAPGDVGELVQALEALIRDPARRQSLGTANIIKIADELTWSINAERYERVYRQALDATKGQLLSREPQMD